MKQHRSKLADFTSESKPRESKYSIKKRQGVEVNHKRHVVPVDWCSKCKKDSRT